MLSEVVSQVAAFLEDAAALRVLAFEVKLHALCLRVLDPDGLVPLPRDSLESLVLASA